MIEFSRVSVPTLREKPADADTASHELLLRAGMMRPVAAGVYTMLPLGARALMRIEDVVRQEMNASGALEVSLPSLHPAELWRKSGRWQEYGPEMMRLNDRQGRAFCLGPTAEELITSYVAREEPSYRDLPVNLYQIQTKFRDEARPRYGLLRGREFRMKDAYSFHVDRKSLDETYGSMYEAYSRIARRCSLEVTVVEAATGLMGGDVSNEFMVLSGVGEDVVVHCTNCGYGANAELESHRPAVVFGSEERDLREVGTPGTETIEEVSGFLGVGSRGILKCVLYVCGGEPLAVFLPGYREVSESKLARILGTEDFHPLRDDERESYPQVTPGFTGPVGLEDVRVIFDREVAGSTGLVCGANKKDFHLVGAVEARDFSAEPLADVARAVDGDLCTVCGAPLSVSRGIEIGHIFKLGTRYSASMDACFTAEDGSRRHMEMGCYGIGTSRMLATVVEQHHDESGITWPAAVAPAGLHMIVIGGPGTEQHAFALETAAGLENRGVEVLLDRRNVSPGIKFNDADLVGLPVQMVAGKKLESDGVVDIKLRAGGDRREFSKDGVLEQIEGALAEAP